MGASSDILYPPTKQEEAAAHIIAGGMYYFINLVSHLFQLNTASKSGYFLFPGLYFFLQVWSLCSHDIFHFMVNE